MDTDIDIEKQEREKKSKGNEINESVHKFPKGVLHTNTCSAMESCKDSCKYVIMKTVRLGHAIIFNIVFVVSRLFGVVLALLFFVVVVRIIIVVDFVFGPFEIMVETFSGRTCLGSWAGQKVPWPISWIEVEAGGRFPHLEICKLCHDIFVVGRG